MGKISEILAGYDKLDSGREITLARKTYPKKDGGSYSLNITYFSAGDGFPIEIDVDIKHSYKDDDDNCSVPRMYFRLTVADGENGETTCDLLRVIHDNPDGKYWELFYEPRGSEDHPNTLALCEANLIDGSYYKRHLTAPNDDLSMSNLDLKPDLYLQQVDPVQVLFHYYKGDVTAEQIESNLFGSYSSQASAASQ